MTLLGRIKALGRAIKEGGESGLFSILGNRSTTEAFKASPIHYFLFPFIAIGVTINWIVETINYARARNKSWFNTGVYITLTAITGLIVTSIMGTVILGEFLAGPFLFVGALSAGIALQMGFFFKNLMHALRSPKGSSQRMGFFQEMGKNVFNAVLMAFTLGLVIAAMISPAGPVILAALGATAATLTVASAIWFFMPKTWKHNIKAFFGFGKLSYEGKTEIEELRELNKTQKTTLGDEKPLIEKESNVVDFNLFKQESRKFEIVKIAESSPKAAREMLQKSIEGHITRLSLTSNHEKTGEALNKQGQKLKVLEHLKEAIANMFDADSELNETSVVTLKSIDALHKEHPKAFQSFFSATSNTESLYESVRFFIENYKGELSSELSQLNSGCKADRGSMGSNP